MATKNAAKYLREALESVAAQTMTDYELVIVDAASTDGTLEIAAEYKNTRVVQQLSRGFADAWNQGIGESQGQFICLLDSDDRWPNDKLQLQFEYLQANPEMDAAIGNVSFFVDTSVEVPSTFRKDLVAGSYVAHMPGAVMVRRHVFDVLGLFDTSLTIASDIDWFAKLKDSGLKVGVINKTLIEKRVHESNLSYTTAKGSKLDEELLLTLRRSILRQRKQANA